MAKTFFFYDLETSGVNPRSSRIMQFAGQRTDESLEPIGEPYNFLVKLSDDVLPEPGAILVTGITPQMTHSEGMTEAEFFKIFIDEIATEDTIFVGFNNIRFDDEFIRFGLYRNFYDPYEWQWKDGRSRWDILDLTRITRALRPEGIEWPFASDGKPTNRLEFLTSVNKLNHESAHDALSDVIATISVARLIMQKQPKLFEYMLKLREKKEIQKFLAENEVFVYASGRYSSAHEKLAVVKNLGTFSDKAETILVCNLLENIEPFLNMDINAIIDTLTYSSDKTDKLKLPIKTLQANKCPAVAPLSVLESSINRLEIDMKVIEKNKELLKNNPKFIENVKKAFDKQSKSFKQSELLIDSLNVDSQLYDGFISGSDKNLSKRLVDDKPENISSYKARFKDERLKILVDLYKARNHPDKLSPDEMQSWEQHKTLMHTKNLPVFVKQFEAYANSQSLSKNDLYLLEEIKMYVESIVSY